LQTSVWKRTQDGSGSNYVLQSKDWKLAVKSKVEKVQIVNESSIRTADLKLY